MRAHLYRLARRVISPLGGHRVRAAKVLPIGEIKNGSLGGVVFAKNRGGHYVRLRSAPTNPNSTRQQAVRGFLVSASGAWSALSPAQHQAWTDWAIAHPQINPLGISYTLTGHQAYVWHATRVLDQGLAALGDPPTGPVPAALLTATVTLTSDTAVSVVFTGTPLPADEAIYLWQGPPQGLTGDPNFKQATLVGYSAQAAASPQAFTLPKTVVSGFTSNFWVGVINGVGQAGPSTKDSDTRP